MTRYGSYKTSYIDWVGEIPSHWETVQPKYKLNRVTRPIDNEDEVITCFRDGVVTLRKNRREDGFTNSIKEHGYQQIHPGDLVVHEMDGFAGAIGISDSKGKSTPVYTVVEPDHRSDLNYIAYLLREMSQTGKIESLARSIRERTTDFRWNMWSVTHFPFPPIEEQKLISRYLDKKTSQIDSLVEKIQKKIELLKEQRTSLINHYVTKGLDPNVEMKDSGIEWIGEIPKHWKLSRIKYLSSVISKGTTPSTVGEDIKETGDVRFLKSENIVDGEVSKYPEFFITNETDEIIKRSRLRPYDVLVVIAGAMVGKSAILDNLIGPANTNQAVSFIRPLDHTRSTLIYRWMSSEYVKRTVQTNSVVSAQPNLSMESLGNFYLPLPPVYEWNEISEFLGDQINKIELLQKFELKKISHLNEYRQSLISSVVTGKVRVTEDMI
jgi:type I restriction enzyme S subunit